MRSLALLSLVPSSALLLRLRLFLRLAARSWASILASHFSREKFLRFSSRFFFSSAALRFAFFFFAMRAACDEVVGWGSREEGKSERRDETR